MYLGMSLKILSGLALGLLYKYYYPSGDTWLYFFEATRLADLARNDLTTYISAIIDPEAQPIITTFHHQPRALFFVKILSSICLLTGNNYWLTSVYLSLFSFSGLWVLANVLIRLNNNKSAAVLSFVLFPSVLFWSSGILKESISSGILAFLVASLVQYCYQLKRLNIFMILLDVLFIYILWNIKYYYAGVFFLVALPLGLIFLVKYLWSNLFSSVKSQVALFVFIMAGTALLVSLIHPNFYLDRVIGVVVENHNAIVESSESGHVIEYDSLTPDIVGVLKNVPKAFFAGLFRPFVGESSDILWVLVGIENLLIFILVISAVISVPANISDEARLYIIALVFYIIIMSTMLALSTPNFGTLTRYKVGFLPYFVYLITLENRAVKWLNQKLF